MFTLTYTVTNGVPPIVVELLGSGKDSNVHNTLQTQDSFVDVENGNYVLRLTDSMGCVVTQDINT